MSTSAASPSLAEIRDRFPSLTSAQPWALLENAGGSQVPGEVIDAVAAYYRNDYVQLGAGYPMSDRATATVDAAHASVLRTVNGEGRGSVILGASTTQLCHLIANCYADTIRPGDEIVLAESGHEANIGPWLRLERAGATIRWWRVDRDAEECTIDTLDAALSERTRLVAFPHVSNLLGGILDVAEVTRRAHRVGARVFVDGVAFAPHRVMDVAAWDVDWYVYSTYKVYGPHMGALYGRADAIGELRGPNHFFIPKDRIPYVFELGGSSHEGCAAIRALDGYLAFLAGDARTGAEVSRSTVARAFGRMAELEVPLQARMVEGLASLPGVRLVGRAPADIGSRVPTVSFRHDRLRAAELVAAAHAGQVAIRSGNMYAYRLCEALGIDPAEGVVRASAVHYNTIAEVDRLIDRIGGAISRAR
jgi:cysteine desulfurase family protein (TIGR01976 family)